MLIEIEPLSDSYFVGNMKVHLDLVLVKKNGTIENKITDPSSTSHMTFDGVNDWNSGILYLWGTCLGRYHAAMGGGVLV